MRGSGDRFEKVENRTSGKIFAKGNNGNCIGGCNWNVQLELILMHRGEICVFPFPQADGIYTGVSKIWRGSASETQLADCRLFGFSDCVLGWKITWDEVCDRSLR